MQFIFLLLICGTLLGHYKAYAEKATAVQIVHLENHSVRVDTNVVNQILGNDHIKDRHVMIFSIAGPYRKGKSFFLNFPLKYLRAQYVKHDISDWIGETGVGSNELSGFKWRGGQKPETTGIWMWSEIFTHDFDNGDRVAILLLDTQGIFDHESSTMDHTTTFTISMMLSSVQCYNVMQNVQEDNLQNLDYFTQYGRLARGRQSNEKPFQKLLFLVRDWPYADEIDYGYAPQYVERIMASSNKQSSEMHELRDRIKSSFEQIDAFLMPYPGAAVAEGKNNGDLRQIDPRFVRSVKEIVPSLFAPENLVVKQINGQKIRAHDFLMYLNEYAKIFNQRTLPEPKTALLATASASLLILHRDCLNHYVRKMQLVMDRHRFFHSMADLLEHHENARKESLQEFQNRPKFYFPGSTASYRTQLENDITDQFYRFKRLNEERKASDSSKDNNGWEVLRNVAVSGLSGGLCAYMGWNPFVAAACAAAGALFG